MGKEKWNTYLYLLPACLLTSYVYLLTYLFFTCLSLCLFVYLPCYLATSLPSCLSARLKVCSLVCQPTFQPTYLSTYLPASLPSYVSDYSPVWLIGSFWTFFIAPCLWLKALYDNNLSFFLKLQYTNMSSQAQDNNRSIKKATTTK